MAFTDQYAVGQDVTFQQQVEVAILLAATQIQGEAKGTKTQVQHRKRAILAESVTSGRGPVIGVDGTVVVTWVVQFSAVIASIDATITLPTSAADDAIISGHVSGNWDNMAGVTGEDLQAQ